MGFVATPLGPTVISSAQAQSMRTTGYVSSINGKQGAVELDLTGGAAGALDIEPDVAHVESADSAVLNLRAADVLIDYTRDAPGSSLRRKDGGLLVPPYWNSQAVPSLLTQKIMQLARARLAYTQWRTSFQGSSTKKGLPPLSRGIDLDLILTDDQEWNFAYGAVNPDIAFTQKRMALQLFPGMSIRSLGQARCVVPLRSPAGPVIATPYRPWSEQAIFAAGTNPVRTNGQIGGFDTTTIEQFCYRSMGTGAVSTGTPYTQWRYAYTPRAVITSDVAAGDSTLHFDNVDGIDRAWFAANSITIPTALTANEIKVGSWGILFLGQNPNDAHEHKRAEFVQVVAITVGGTTVTTAGQTLQGAGTITFSRPSPVDVVLANEHSSFPTKVGQIFVAQPSGPENVESHCFIPIDPNMYCEGAYVGNLDFIPDAAGVATNSYVSMCSIRDPRVANLRGFAPGFQLVDFNGTWGGRMDGLRLLGSNSDAQPGGNPQNVGMLFDLTTARDVHIHDVVVEGFYRHIAQLESYSNAVLRDLWVVNDHPAAPTSENLVALNGKSRIRVEGRIRGDGRGAQLVSRAGGEDDVNDAFTVHGDVEFASPVAASPWLIRGYDIAPGSRIRYAGTVAGSVVDWKFDPARRWNPIAIPFTKATSGTVNVTAPLPRGWIREIVVKLPAVTTGLTGLVLTNGGLSAPVTLLKTACTHVSGTATDSVGDGIGSDADRTLTSSTAEFATAEADDIVVWPGGNLDGTDYKTTVQTVTDSSHIIITDLLPHTLSSGTTIRVGDTAIAGQAVRLGKEASGVWFGSSANNFSGGKMVGEAAGTAALIKATFDTTVVDTTADITVWVETFPQSTPFGTQVTASPADPAPPAITGAFDKTGSAWAAALLTALRSQGVIQDQTTDSGSPLGGPQYAVRTSDAAAVNNSTTFVVSTVLLLPLAANATYLFRARIFYDADATADLKMGWNVPSGATGKWTPNGYQNGVANAATAATINRSQIDIGSGAVAGGVGVGTSSTATAEPSGVVQTGATAGNLTFKYAQSSAVASDLVIRALSMLEVVRIA